jgi:hypothetical protein
MHQACRRHNEQVSDNDGPSARSAAHSCSPTAVHQTILAGMVQRAACRSKRMALMHTRALSTTMRSLDIVDLQDVALSVGATEAYLDVRHSS